MPVTFLAQDILHRCRMCYFLRFSGLLFKLSISVGVLVSTGLAEIRAGVNYQN